ncbi:MAG: GNAT family N-acetyltransferase [Nanoarchaeota archaeon]|nr:GNAT family N-acetyltransferase [Nanoarchaeota archaeon]
MKKVLIRSARKKDINLIGEVLEIQELGRGYSKEYLVRLIKNKGGIFLVADYNSKIIGIVFGEVNKKENWAELSGIAVLEGYRNNGIGSAFLREFERRVRNRGVTFIETFASVNYLADKIGKFGYERKETYVNFIKDLD